MSKNRKVIAAIQSLRERLPDNIVRNIVKRQREKLYEYYTKDNLFRKYEMKDNARIINKIMKLQHSSNALNMEYVDMETFMMKVDDIVVVHSFDREMSISTIIIYIKFDSYKGYLKLMCDTVTSINNNNVTHDIRNIKIEKIRSTNIITNNLKSLNINETIIKTVRHKNTNNNTREYGYYLSLICFSWYNLVYKEYYENRMDKFQNITLEGLRMLKSVIKPEYKTKPVMRQNKNNGLTQEQKRILQGNINQHRARYYNTPLSNKLQRQIEQLLYNQNNPKQKKRKL